MTYIKALFDIQKVQQTNTRYKGGEFYYNLYYKNDNNQFELVTDIEFKTRAAANDYINELLEGE